jgi:hypothetical protein
MNRYKPLIEKTKKSEAYWISPQRKILPMGDSKHIKEVIKNPGAFGYTEEELKKIYAKHDEIYGIEGTAREEIILALIQKDWIRIRKYTKPYRWTANIKLYTDSVKDILEFWAAEMIEAGYSPNDDVLIDTVNSNKVITLLELSKEILYNENETPKHSDHYKFINSVFEF